MPKKKKAVPLGGRPTEYGTGLAAAVVAVIALAFHLGDEWVAPLVVIVGAVPGAITFLVEAWRKR